MDTYRGSRGHDDGGQGVVRSASDEARLTDLPVDHRADDGQVLGARSVAFLSPSPAKELAPQP